MVEEKDHIRNLRAPHAHTLPPASFPTSHLDAPSMILEKRPPLGRRTDIRTLLVRTEHERLHMKRHQALPSLPSQKIQATLP
jgi:hypothetical protein